MPTAITIGKFSICAVLLMGALSAFAAPVIVREATFEDCQLGDFPEKVFGGGWGSHSNGKFFYVTNVHGCKSEKCLAIKILPKVGGMFGIGFPLKTPSNASKGVVHFEMDIMREGMMNFYSEIRCADGKWNLWWVGDKLYLCGIMGGYGSGSIRPEGGFKPFKWYHIKYAFPLTIEDGITSSISITDVETGKEYKEVWDKVVTEVKPRLGDKWFYNPDSPMNLVFNFYPDYYGNPGMFYFDNLKSYIE